MSRFSDLAYCCRKCKRKLVGEQNVVLQVMPFRFTREGKQMVATLIWCSTHAPKQEEAA